VTGSAAVVVNHDAGAHLIECVASLRADGIARIVVVDNASTDGSTHAVIDHDPDVTIVWAGANLGYGAGVNRGLAELDRLGSKADAGFVLVSNPDVAVHPGAVAALSETLRRDRSVAIAGPQIREVDGSRYPSARRFPSWVDAAGHAILGTMAPGNRFSRRYRMGDVEPEAITKVDWVSGACFLADREALRDLGGFDERYFMYLEDVDLCWRAHRAGFDVAYVPIAIVTHAQGVSTARHPYRMLVAHHRSALRFASRRTDGWRRAGLPLVAAVLALRLTAAAFRHAVGGRARV